MKLKKKKLNKDRVLFKKRKELSARKLRLHFGTHGIHTGKMMRFELIYFVILRKIIKRHKNLLWLKYITFKRMWFWLRKNYIVSRKSKNARMGKGKGKFLRYAVLIPKNYMLIEFFGWHNQYIKNIANMFSGRINIPIYMHTNEPYRSVTCAINKNYNYMYIRKKQAFCLSRYWPHF